MLLFFIAIIFVGAFETSASDETAYTVLVFNNEAQTRVTRYHPAFHVL